MKRLLTFPEPNPRHGPLTLTEYELVEFAMTMPGQDAVYSAIVRTSERHYQQVTTLPRQIDVTVPAAPVPEPASPGPDLSRPLLQFAATVVVLWIVTGVVLALWALVEGVAID